MAQVKPVTDGMVAAGAAAATSEAESTCDCDMASSSLLRSTQSSWGCIREAQLNTQQALLPKYSQGARRKSNN